jgi:hypothetical protein
MHNKAKYFLLFLIGLLTFSTRAPETAAYAGASAPRRSPAERPSAPSQPAAPAAILPATASQLAAAMDVPGADLIAADLMGSDDEGVGVSNAPFARWFPVKGSTFAILSTGFAADANQPQPMSGPTGKLTGLLNSDLGDLVRLQLTLKVPANAQCLSFDFAFHSAEYGELDDPNKPPDPPPDTLGNDTFTAQLDDDALSISGVTVTAPGNFAVTGAGKNVAILSGFTVNPFTQSVYYAATSLFQASTPVTAGSTIDLYLSIQDLYDDEIDSAVFLDNFQWSTPSCPAGLTDLITTVYLPFMAR